MLNGRNRDCDALTAMLDDDSLTEEEITTTRESGTSSSPGPFPQWKSWEMSDFGLQLKKFSAPNS